MPEIKYVRKQERDSNSWFWFILRRINDLVITLCIAIDFFYRCNGERGAFSIVKGMTISTLSVWTTLFLVACIHERIHQVTYKYYGVDSEIYIHIGILPEGETNVNGVLRLTILELMMVTLMPLFVISGVSVMGMIYIDPIVFLCVLSFNTIGSAHDLCSALDLADSVVRTYRHKPIPLVRYRCKRRQIMH